LSPLDSNYQQKKLLSSLQKIDSIEPRKERYQKLLENKSAAKEESAQGVKEGFKP
jgi:hypothetical protein